MNAGIISLIALGLAACVPPDAPISAITGARNVCDSDATCGEGTCVDRVCLALPPLVLEDLVAVVSPTPFSGYPSIPHVIALDAITSQRTFFEGRDDDGTARWLKLPRLIENRFRVGLSDEYLALRPGCPSDIRAEISLISTARAAAGLPVFDLVSSLRDAEGRVSILAEKGQYDVFVRPLAPDADCPMPPLLIRGFRDQSNILLPPPDVLEVTIATPSGVSFEGYPVEIVDGGGGRVLSLSSFVGPNGAVRVFFSKPAQVSPDASSVPGYWLRVRPPASLAVPTFAWDATLLSQGAILDLTALSLKSVRVQATLERGDTAVRIDGFVYAHSLPVAGSTTSLLGIPPGVLAAFSTSAPATSEGGFEFVVPQGVFQLVGAARDSSLSLGTGKIEARVSSSSEGISGAVLSAAQPARVEVSVRPPVGAGTDVVVEARPRSPLRGPFDVAFSADAPVARPGQAAVDASGVARLSLDRGAYDVVAKFDARSQYGWVVATNVLVAGDMSLDLAVALPFEVRGRILTPAASDGSTPEEELPPLAGGIIRVFGRIGPSSRYVELSDGVLDDAGGFRVFLPSRLAP